MKKADFKILGKETTFNNCTFNIKNETNTPNKLKDVTIMILVVVVATLAVSHFCPELLPDIIRLGIRVALGN